MIRRRLAHGLDWRLRAVVERLDSLAGRTEQLQMSVRSAEARAQSLAGQLVELTRMVAELEPLVVTAVQAADDAAATRGFLEQNVMPALRAVVDAESANRRRLYAARGNPEYESAYTQANPLVSVTIATWGRPERLVGRALPSVLAQTYTNLEILVVGDACEPDVAEAVGAIGDHRVRYDNLTQRLVAHPEAGRHWLVGSTMARNEATRRARGQWLLHFDDDDYLRPDAVGSLLACARTTRAEVAYGGFDEHLPDVATETHSAFPPAPESFGWQGALVHHGLRFFERELVAAYLGLPGDMYMLERMLRTGVRFALLPRVVWDYYPSSVWESATAAARISQISTTVEGASSE